MNKKHLIFSTIGILFLSFAAAVSITPRDFSTAKADAPTDVGQVHLSLNTGTSEISTSNAIHLLSDVTNDFPVNGWDNYFTSSESNSLTLNGVDVHGGGNGVPVRLKKIATQKYYLALNDSGLGSRNVDDTVVIKGNWTGTVGTTTYTMYVNEFSATWNGSKWVQNFVVPELETYDRISLVDLSLEDIDGVKMDTEGSTNAYNSFTPSAENTHNNFVFEFYYEAASKNDNSLDIRFGGDKGWDESSHFYQVKLFNSWGPTGQGYFLEKNKGTTLHGNSVFDCNLTINVRHTIEIGSIVVKNSNDIYSYLKIDDEYYYREVYTPSTIESTSRISFSHQQADLFIGNTKEQKANTDALTFKNSDGLNGVYLYGPSNGIPTNTRGVPATKYNLYRNNGILYNFPINATGPLKKSDAEEYYVSFSENNIEVADGDVVSIGGEFHFYRSAKNYTMAVIPFCVKRIGNQFVDAGTLDEYLIDAITDYVDFDYYDNDKIPTLNSLIASTQANVESANTVKAKWQAFEDGKDLIDAVPPKEELLIKEKEQAIAELNSYDDEFMYEEAELEAVRSYIEAGTTAINASTTIQQVKTALNNAISQIKALTTRQEHVENRIINRESGYEQYLAKHEVITTTDLCATGDLSFYAQDSSQETYWTQFGSDSIYGRFVTSKDNQDGNVAFKFNYKSTDPTSKKYASQIFIRLRGTASNCYLFNIATTVEGQVGVSFGKFINDAMVDEKSTKYSFPTNTDVEIEIGAIDLKDYNRVYLYILVDGTSKVAEIVDPLNIQHTPTVLIQDSYTADGTNNSATMSPIEEGTTKAQNAKRVGRLVVDSSSDNETLVPTLRKNSIPVYTNFYPIEKDAFLYNGNELDNHHTGAILRKLTETQYLITTTGLTIGDGDTIKIGGCFASFNGDTFEKTAIKITETTFTYHASSNSWTQTEQTLEDAILDAIVFLDGYADLDAYTDANRATVENIVTNYKAQISVATSVAQVDQLVSAAVAAIDAVPTILTTYKNAAKTELNNYKSPSIYRQEEQNKLSKLLNEAYQKIDACNDENSVDYIVLTTKQAIDQLKTDAEYYAEELQSKQRSAKAEIESFIGKVELSRYSEENAALIQKLALDARRDVDAATTIEGVDNIVSAFKEAVKNVATNDGTVFDGEKYTKKKKGCSAEIVSMAIVVPAVSLAALAILVCVRRKESYLTK